MFRFNVSSVQNWWWRRSHENSVNLRLNVFILNVLFNVHTHVYDDILAARSTVVGRWQTYTALLRHGAKYQPYIRLRQFLKVIHNYECHTLTGFNEHFPSDLSQHPLTQTHAHALARAHTYNPYTHEQPIAYLIILRHAKTSEFFNVLS